MRQIDAIFNQNTDEKLELAEAHATDRAELIAAHEAKFKDMHSAFHQQILDLETRYAVMEKTCLEELQQVKQTSAEKLEQVIQTSSSEYLALQESSRAERTTIMESSKLELERVQTVLQQELVQLRLDSKAAYEALERTSQAELSRVQLRSAEELDALRHSSSSRIQELEASSAANIEYVTGQLSQELSNTKLNAEKALQAMNEKYANEQARLQDNAEREIARLNMDREEQLVKLSARREEETSMLRNDLDIMNSRYSAEIQQLRDTYTRDAANATADANAKTAALIELHDTEMAALQEKMKLEVSSAHATFESKISLILAQHKSEIEGFQEESTRVHRDLVDKYEEELLQVKEESRREKDTIVLKYETDLDELKRTSKDQLDKLTKAHETQLMQIRESHGSKLMSLERTLRDNQATHDKVQQLNESELESQQHRIEELELTEIAMKKRLQNSALASKEALSRKDMDLFEQGARILRLQEELRATCDTLDEARKELKQVLDDRQVKASTILELTFVIKSRDDEIEKIRNALLDSIQTVNNKTEILEITAESLSSKAKELEDTKAKLRLESGRLSIVEESMHQKEEILGDTELKIERMRLNMDNMRLEMKRMQMDMKLQLEHSEGEMDLKNGEIRRLHAAQSDLKQKNDFFQETIAELEKSLAAAQRQGDEAERRIALMKIESAQCVEDIRKISDFVQDKETEILILGREKNIANSDKQRRQIQLNNMNHLVQTLHEKIEVKCMYAEEVQGLCLRTMEETSAEKDERMRSERNLLLLELSAIKEMVRHYEGVEGRLAESKKEVENQEATIFQLHGDIRTLQDIVEHYKTIERLLDTAKNEINEKNDNLCALKEELKYHHASAQRDYEKSESLLAHQKEACESLQLEIRLLKGDLETELLQRTVLENELLQLHKVKASCESQIREYQHRLQRNTKQLEGSAMEQEDVTAQLRQQNECNSFLSQKLAEVVEKLSTEQKEHNAQVKKLTEDMKKAVETLENMSSELQKACSDMSHLQVRYDKASQELQYTHDDLTRLQEQSESRTKEAVDKMSAVSLDHASQIQDLLKQKNELQRTLELEIQRLNDAQFDESLKHKLDKEQRRAAFEKEINLLNAKHNEEMEILDKKNEAEKELMRAAYEEESNTKLLFDEEKASMVLKFDQEIASVTFAYKADNEAAKKLFGQERSSMAAAYVADKNATTKAFEQEMASMTAAHTAEKEALNLANGGEKASMVAAYEAEKEAARTANEEEKLAMAAMYEGESKAMVDTFEQQKNSIIGAFEAEKDVMKATYEQERDLMIAAHESEKSQMDSAFVEEKKLISSKYARQIELMRAKYEEDTELMRAELEEDKDRMKTNYEEDIKSIAQTFENKMDFLNHKHQKEMDMMSTRYELETERIRTDHQNEIDTICSKHEQEKNVIAMKFAEEKVIGQAAEAEFKQQIQSINEQLGAQRTTYDNEIRKLREIEGFLSENCLSLAFENATITNTHLSALRRLESTCAGLRNDLLLLKQTSDHEYERLAESYRAEVTALSDTHKNHLAMRQRENDDIQMQLEAVTHSWERSIATLSKTLKIKIEGVSNDAAIGDKLRGTLSKCERELEELAESARHEIELTLRIKESEILALKDSARTKNEHFLAILNDHQSLIAVVNQSAEETKQRLLERDSELKSVQEKLKVKEVALHESNQVVMARRATIENVRKGKLRLIMKYESSLSLWYCIMIELTLMVEASKGVRSEEQFVASLRQQLDTFLSEIYHLKTMAIAGFVLEEEKDLLECLKDYFRMRCCMIQAKSGKIESVLDVQYVCSVLQDHSLIGEKYSELYSDKDSDSQGGLAPPIVQLLSEHTQFVAAIQEVFCLEHQGDVEHLLSILKAHSTLFDAIGLSTAIDRKEKLSEIVNIFAQRMQLLTTARSNFHDVQDLKDVEQLLLKTQNLLSLTRHATSSESIQCLEDLGTVMEEAAILRDCFDAIVNHNFLESEDWRTPTNFLKTNEILSFAERSNAFVSSCASALNLKSETASHSDIICAIEELMKILYHFGMLCPRKKQENREYVDSLGSTGVWSSSNTEIAQPHVPQTLRDIQDQVSGLIAFLEELRLLSVFAQNILDEENTAVASVTGFSCNSSSDSIAMDRSLTSTPTSTTHVEDDLHIDLPTPCDEVEFDLLAQAGASNSGVGDHSVEAPQGPANILSDSLMDISLIMSDHHRIISEVAHWVKKNSSQKNDASLDVGTEIGRLVREHCSLLSLSRSLFKLKDPRQDLPSLLECVAALNQMTARLSFLEVEPSSDSTDMRNDGSSESSLRSLGTASSTSIANSEDTLRASLSVFASLDDIARHLQDYSIFVQQMKENKAWFIEGNLDSIESLTNEIKERFVLLAQAQTMLSLRYPYEELPQVLSEMLELLAHARQCSEWVRAQKDEDPAEPPALMIGVESILSGFNDIAQNLDNYSDFILWTKRVLPSSASLQTIDDIKDSIRKLLDQLEAFKMQNSRMDSIFARAATLYQRDTTTETADNLEMIINEESMSRNRIDICEKLVIEFESLSREKRELQTDVLIEAEFLEKNSLVDSSLKGVLSTSARISIYNSLLQKLHGLQETEVRLREALAAERLLGIEHASSQSRIFAEEFDLEKQTATRKLRELEAEIQEVRSEKQSSVNKLREMIKTAEDLASEKLLLLAQMDEVNRVAKDFETEKKAVTVKLDEAGKLVEDLASAKRAALTELSEVKKLLEEATSEKHDILRKLDEVKASSEKLDCEKQSALEKLDDLKKFSEELDSDKQVALNKLDKMKTLIDELETEKQAAFAELTTLKGVVSDLEVEKQDAKKMQSVFEKRIEELESEKQSSSNILREMEELKGLEIVETKQRSIEYISNLEQNLEAMIMQMNIMRQDLDQELDRERQHSGDAIGEAKQAVENLTVAMDIMKQELNKQLADEKQHSNDNAVKSEQQLSDMMNQIELIKQEWEIRLIAEKEVSKVLLAGVEQHLQHEVIQKQIQADESLQMMESAFVKLNRKITRDIVCEKDLLVASRHIFAVDLPTVDDLYSRIPIYDQFFDEFRRISCEKERAESEERQFLEMHELWSGDTAETKSISMIRANLYKQFIELKNHLRLEKETFAEEKAFLFQNNLEIESDDPIVFRALVYQRLLDGQNALIEEKMERELETAKEQAYLESHGLVFDDRFDAYKALVDAVAQKKQTQEDAERELAFLLQNNLVTQQKVEANGSVIDTSVRLQLYQELLILKADTLLARSTIEEEKMFLHQNAQMDSVQIDAPECSRVSVYKAFLETQSVLTKQIEYMVAERENEVQYLSDHAAIEVELVQLEMTSGRIDVYNQFLKRIRERDTNLQISYIQLEALERSLMAWSEIPRVDAAVCDQIVQSNAKKLAQVAQGYQEERSLAAKKFAQELADTKAVSEAQLTKMLNEHEIAIHDIKNEHQTEMTLALQKQAKQLEFRAAVHRNENEVNNRFNGGLSATQARALVLDKVAKRDTAAMSMIYRSIRLATEILNTTAFAGINTSSTNGGSFGGGAGAGADIPVDVTQAVFSCVKELKALKEFLIQSLEQITTNDVFPGHPSFVKVNIDGAMASCDKESAIDFALCSHREFMMYANTQLLAQQEQTNQMLVHLFQSLDATASGFSSDQKQQMEMEISLTRERDAKETTERSCKLNEVFYHRLLDERKEVERTLTSALNELREESRVLRTKIDALEQERHATSSGMGLSLGMSPLSSSSRGLLATPMQSPRMASPTIPMRPEKPREPFKTKGSGSVHKERFVSDLEKETGQRRNINVTKRMNDWRKHELIDSSSTLEKGFREMEASAAEFSRGFDQETQSKTTRPGTGMRGANDQGLWHQGGRTIHHMSFFVSVFHVPKQNLFRVEVFNTETEQPQTIYVTRAEMENYIAESPKALRTGLSLDDPSKHAEIVDVLFERVKVYGESTANVLLAFE